MEDYLKSIGRYGGTAEDLPLEEIEKNINAGNILVMQTWRSNFGNETHCMDKCPHNRHYVAIVGYHEEDEYGPAGIYLLDAWAGRDWNNPALPSGDGHYLFLSWHAVHDHIYPGEENRGRVVIVTPEKNENATNISGDNVQK
jgi:hypothetical protein